MIKCNLGHIFTFVMCSFRGMDEKDPTQEELKVYVRVRPQQQKDRIWVRAVDEHRLRTTNHRNVEEDLEYE